MTRESILNFNVGVLGHIDSGKTSLSMALSTVSSTACFDKNPQSKERGITLDLGFSSFTVDPPDHVKSTCPEIENIQITLVDCPGHASLIRTIIGGAQIVDMMLLVVDINKGMQTQTAECLVIGQIVCNCLIVVLNKIDLIEEGRRALAIDKMTKRFHKTLESTKFRDAPIIPVSAKLGQEDKADVNLLKLIKTLRQYCYIPDRKKEGALVMSVDHCFTIKGQGTIMTGTILSGRLIVNDTIEVPSLKISKKVKSIQSYKQPVTTASQGDRIGVCVTQFDSNLLERGLVCTPNHLSQVHACIASIAHVPYFKGSVATGKKFHLTLGHVTVMGKVTFFEGNKKDFSFDSNFEYLEELPAISASDGKVENQNGLVKVGGDAAMVEKSLQDLKNVNLSEEQSVGDLNNVDAGMDKNLVEAEVAKFHFALIEYENPVVCGKDFLLIGSKLDFDVHTNSCRLAFHGRTLHTCSEDYRKAVLPNLKVFKTKHREGQVERLLDKNTAICVGLFKKETNFNIFANLRVTLETGEAGRIEGSFGQSGKAKIYFPDGLAQSTVDEFEGRPKRSKKQENAGPPATHAPVKVYLAFRKYIYDGTKVIRQTPL